MSETRFLKIKHNPKEKKTILAYQVANRGDWDDHIVSTKDEPHPDFLEALKGLARGVLRLCELEQAIDPDELTVRGVSISYGKDETKGVVVTALRELRTSPAPLVLNTPHKLLEERDENTPEDQIAPRAVVEAVNRLEREAKAFLGGKRSQGDLFEGAENDGSTKGITSVTISAGGRSIRLGGDGDLSDDIAGEFDRMGILETADVDA